VRLLANSKARLGRYPNQARLHLSEPIAVVCLHLVEGRPLLPVVPHILPVIQADCTCFRHGRAGHILGATGDTNRVDHGVPPVSTLVSSNDAESSALFSDIARDYARLQQTTMMLLLAAVNGS
jgi:hypothetical protein